nr:hypothetical protein [Candidatus Gracilibacteria bacterium]
MQNNIVELILGKINKKEEISPFLFLGAPIHNINSQVEELSIELLEKLGINKNFVFDFKDNNEKIKVKDIKDFLDKVYITPSFGSQIFIIENISRMTEESANSCLKIFEEPPIGNIILLTNESESGILETILSRCTTINTKDGELGEKNHFYYDMIDDYIRGIDHDLASFIFKEKLEKDDYINLLKTLILYFKEKNIFLDLIEEINDDINGIQKNNLLPKYIVDKYIIKIGHK